MLPRRPAGRRAARPAAAVLAPALAGALVLSGCGAQPAGPDPRADERPAAATVADARPVVPQRGPFRHTGRGEFRSSIEPVTAARLGVTHRAGCPVPVEDLRLVRLTHLGFDGSPRLGELVVHRSQAAAVVEVFRQLYDAQFPIERMVTVEQYGGDDDRSMAANNTSAFNCRTTTSGTRWSEHAYGTALDVNPVQNPYVSGSTVLPEAGRAYLDRSHLRPGMVVSGGVVVRAFADAGWGWGGSWSSSKDYQHFSASGR